MDHISKWVISRLKRHEGLKLKPYIDSTGHISIGYGRNLTDNGITVKEAEYLFLNDMRNVESELISRVPIYGKLSAIRRGVLLNMAYNLGVPRLLGFKRMFAALEARDYVLAAVEMLDSKWASQVGYRAFELAYMMRKNEIDNTTGTREGG